MRKGFTLIELLISAAIIGIVILSINISFKASASFFIRIEENQRALGSLKNIETYLYDRVAYVEELEILENLPSDYNGDNADWYYIYSKNGNIVLVDTTITPVQQKDIFSKDEEFYSLKFEKSSLINEVLKIEIAEEELTNNSKTTDVRLGNLFQGNRITDSTVSGESSIIRFKTNLPIESEVKLTHFMFEEDENETHYNWVNDVYSAPSIIVDGAEQLMTVTGKPVYAEGTDIIEDSEGNKIPNIRTDFEGNTVFEQIVYIPVDKNVNISALKPTMKFEGDRVYKDNMLIKWKTDVGEEKTTKRTYNWQNDSIIRVEKVNGDVVEDVAVYKIVTYVESEPRLHSFNFLEENNNFLYDGMSSITKNPSNINHADSIGYINQGYENIYSPIFKNNEVNVGVSDWKPTFSINGDKVTLINSGDEKNITPLNERELISGNNLPIGAEIPLYPDMATLRVYLGDKFREYNICMYSNPLIDNIAFEDTMTNVSYESVELEQNSTSNFYFVTEKDYRNLDGKYGIDFLTNALMVYKKNGPMGIMLDSGMDINNDNILQPYSHEVSSNYIDYFILQRENSFAMRYDISYLSSPAIMKEMTFINDGTRNNHLYNEKYAVRADIETSLTSNEKGANTITFTFLRNEYLKKLTPIFNFSGNRVKISYNNGVDYEMISSGIDTIDLSNLKYDDINTDDKQNKVLIKIEYDSIDEGIKEREYTVKVNYYEEPKLENVSSISLIKNGREVSVNTSYTYNYKPGIGIAENRPRGTASYEWWFDENWGSSVNLTEKYDFITEDTTTLNMYRNELDEHFKKGGELYYKVIIRSEEYEVDGVKYGSVIANPTLESDRITVSGVLDLPYTMYAKGGIHFYGRNYFKAEGHIHGNYLGHSWDLGNNYHSLKIFTQFKHDSEFGDLTITGRDDIVGSAWGLGTNHSNNNNIDYVDSVTGSRVTIKENSGSREMPSYGPVLDNFYNDSRNGLNQLSSFINTSIYFALEASSGKLIKYNELWNVLLEPENNKYNWIEANRIYLREYSDYSAWGSSSKIKNIWDKVMVLKGIENSNYGAIYIEGYEYTDTTTGSGADALAGTDRVVDVVLGSPENPVILYAENGRIYLGGNVQKKYRDVENLTIYGLVYSEAGRDIYVDARNVNIIGSVVGGRDIIVRGDYNQVFTIKKFDNPDTSNLNYEKIVLY